MKYLTPAVGSCRGLGMLAEVLSQEVNAYTGAARSNYLAGGVWKSDEPNQGYPQNARGSGGVTAPKPLNHVLVPSDWTNPIKLLRFILTKC
jgi:hypothetical protein